MSKKKKETYILTPKGVFISHLPADVADKIINDLYMTALKNDYNAILFDEGKIDWVKIVKK